MSSVSPLNPSPASSSTPLPAQPTQGLRERVDVLLDKLPRPSDEDGETLEKAADADETTQATPPGVGCLRVEHLPAAGLFAMARAQVGRMPAALQPLLAGLRAMKAEKTPAAAPVIESRSPLVSPVGQVISLASGMQAVTPAMKGDAKLPPPSLPQSLPLAPLAAADGAGKVGHGGEPKLVPGRLHTAPQHPVDMEVPLQAAGLPGVIRSSASPGEQPSVPLSKPPAGPGTAMVQRTAMAMISKATTITVPFTAYGPGHQVTAIWTPVAFPGMASQSLQPLLIRSSSEMGHRAVGMAIAAGLTPQGGHWQIEATQETDNGSQQRSGHGGDPEDDE